MKSPRAAWATLLPPAAQHVATLLGGALAAQLLLAAVAPILSRLYTDEDFGLLAVFGVGTLGLPIPA